MSPYIQVPVLEEHVPKVYELLAQLGQADRNGSGEPVPGDEAEAESQPVPELDEALVKRMYDESWDTHKALLSHLAENAGSWVYSNELVTALNLRSGSKSVAGMFGAFGRRTKHRYGGAKPWDIKWDQDRGEAKYRMKPEVAAWVKAAAAS